MNLYAVSAVYGSDRDVALFLAEDDAAALALAGQGHDPRGLGTAGTEIWLIAADCKQVGELPGLPAPLPGQQPGPPRTLAELAAGPTAAELLSRATGPG